MIRFDELEKQETSETLLGASPLIMYASPWYRNYLNGEKKHNFYIEIILFKIDFQIKKSLGEV